jgi:hypothetical protein
VGWTPILLVEPGACHRMFKDSNNYRVGARTTNHPLVYKNYCALWECHLLWRFHRVNRSHVENVRRYNHEPMKSLPLVPFPSTLHPPCLLSISQLTTYEFQGFGWLFEGPPDTWPLAYSLRLRASIRPLHRAETRVHALHRVMQSHVHRECQIPRPGNCA